MASLWRVRSWLNAFSRRELLFWIQWVAFQTMHLAPEVIEFPMDQLQVRVVTCLVPTIDGVGDKVGDLHHS